MAPDGKAEGEPRQYLPLTCHGHSRPVPHLSFSSLERDGDYFMISACKGMLCALSGTLLEAKV